MKNILFFTFGDSSSASTWSNVPYCFSKELERRGIIVKRINISPNKHIVRIWDRSIGRFFRVVWPGNSYSFIRTPIASTIIWRKIKAAVQCYPNADLCVFLTFDYYNKFSKVPSLLFSDWTYKILVERNGRKPYFFERSYYRHEDTIINAANFVVSLFPDCARRMKLDYPKANIQCFETNVINLLYDKPIRENDVLVKKKERKNIVFIGNRRYKDSLMLLLMAFQKVQNVRNDVELHVIGMKMEQTGIEGHNIHYYGYLRKDVMTERNKYYETLISASIIVNISPQWGGYSSIVEAMYFYTPIIVAPYQEFVAEFGEDITFGLYNKDYSEECLTKNLLNILQTDHYDDMCKAAHNRVEHYTWEEYVNKIEQLVEQ